jgi:hypothetical protein
MARFGRDFVRGATQPAYLEGLFQAGKNIGGYSRKKEQIQNSREAFNIYEQGLASARDANVGGLSAATSKLSGMLSETTDENVMSDLMQKISNLGKLTTATETAKASRNVDDLIKAENFLEELKGKGENITANESRIMEGVQQRVDQLRGDAAVVTSANAKRRDFRIASLTKNEALAVAEANAMKRDMSQYQPGSAQWAEASKKYQGKFGSELEALEKNLLKVQTEKLDAIDKINKRTPLNEEDVATLKEAGFKPTKDILADRKRLETIRDEKTKRSIATAFRYLDPATAGLARATVIDRLREIVKEGDLEDYPIMEDMEDKVLKILENPDEVELFLGRVEGAPRREIDNIVDSYLRDQFTTKFKEMEKEIQRKSGISSVKRGAISEIASATNAARGTAAFEAGLIDEDRPLQPGEEGYFDLEDPEDADRAMIAYERQQKKKQKSAQLEAEKGVMGGEKESIGFLRGLNR